MNLASPGRRWWVSRSVAAWPCSSPISIATTAHGWFSSAAAAWAPDLSWILRMLSAPGVELVLPCGVDSRAHPTGSKHRLRVFDGGSTAPHRGLASLPKASGRDRIQLIGLATKSRPAPCGRSSTGPPCCSSASTCCPSSRSPPARFTSSGWPCIRPVRHRAVRADLPEPGHHLVRGHGTRPRRRDRAAGTVTLVQPKPNHRSKT